MVYIVGCTACPSGVAHTYMSAEALIRAGEAKGFNVRIETQGSIGIESALTQEEIDRAQYVILTSDIAIKGEDRFAGKKVIKMTASDCIKKAKALMEKIGVAYERDYK